MARSPFSVPVKARNGQMIANARVALFLAGTSTAVSDVYTGSSGGSPVTTLLSDSSGQINGWVDTPKLVKMTVSDNSDTAFLAGDSSSLVSFSDVTYDNVPLYENPADGEADDATLDGLVTAVTANTTAINNLKLSGTFAARPAAGTAGRFYFATDQGLFYRDNGTSWQRIVGGPNEIWVTDFGAAPSNSNPGGTQMTANVAAFNSAIALARTGLNATVAPFYECAVVVPGTVAGYKYWVNAPINFEQIEIRGLNGSIHAPGGEKNTRVWIDGSQIASGYGVFEIKDTGITAGVATVSSLSNLYVAGNTNAVRNEGRAFLSIRDCDLYSADTSSTDRAALYLENCFWIRVERVGMTCNGSSYASDARNILMVVSNDTVGDVQGVCQAMFRDIVFNYGQVRFENRRSTGVRGGDSANVQFVDCVSESCQTQPFVDYVRTTGSATIGHDLAHWTFDHCERADATTVGASFLSMDFGTDSPGDQQSTMKNVTIRGTNPYAQYWLRAVHRGGFQNVTIFGALKATVICSADTTGSVRGVRRATEDGWSAASNVEEGDGTLNVVNAYSGPATALWRVENTGRMVTLGSTTARAGINAPHGTAPTSPTNGDIWTTTTGLFARINGSTVGPYLANPVEDARAAAYRPTAYQAETVPRISVTQRGMVLGGSGKETVAAVYLKAGQVLNTITVWSGDTAAGTPTNQWFSLRDSALNLLRVTNDDTTTAWATDAAKTLTLASSYTVTTSGLYYVGIMVAAAVVPTTHGTTAGPSQTLMNVAPALCGFDNTHSGLTTPGTAPATLTLNAGVSTLFYAGIA